MRRRGHRSHIDPHMDGFVEVKRGINELKMIFHNYFFIALVGRHTLMALDIDDDLIICIEERSAEAAVDGSRRWAGVERMIGVAKRREVHHRCLGLEASAFGEGRVRRPATAARAEGRVAALMPELGEGDEAYD